MSTKHDGRIHKYLTEIDGEVKALLSAANSLEITPKPQEIDLNLMLNSMLRNVKIQYRNIQIQAELSSDLYQVTAIYSQLADAIWNVISNALDAMPEAGTLILKSRNTLSC